MSELEQLIDRLCPYGVELRELSQVLTIKNGKDYKSNSNGAIPVYGTGGIIAYIDRAIFTKPSVLIPRKGSLDKLYYVEVPFWTVDTIFYTEIRTEMVEPKFVFYYLQTQHLEELNMAGGVPSLTQTILNRVTIPLPPLPVQREIVRILDKYTELTAELTAELKAELTARKKQYEHYRGLLMTYEDTRQWHALGDIADIGTGSSNTNEELEVGKYPFFVRSQEVRSKNTYEYDEVAIITSGDGVGVGKIFHYIQGKYALHQRAYRIHIKDERILPKYLYHYMRSAFLPYIQKNAVNSSVTSIRRRMLDEFPIPDLPMHEQERIVGILDRFDILIDDVNLGFPAEIEARRKQYEYYRNKLLAFKERSA